MAKPPTIFCSVAENSSLSSRRWRKHDNTSLTQLPPQKSVFDWSKANVVQAAVEGEGGQDESRVGEQEGQTGHIKERLGKRFFDLVKETETAASIVEAHK